MYEAFQENLRQQKARKIAEYRAEILRLWASSSTFSYVVVVATELLFAKLDDLSQWCEFTSSSYPYPILGVVGAARFLLTFSPLRRQDIISPKNNVV